ncbi:solute carrier family 26 member 10-like isoform X6 [Manis pentadactyla]|uniref:solute carrier family 26 member 10-like isoform X6 n=1 Tax=Manis pentadactyla TaxID=143292 RepID=UPI00255D04E4|nr:solute carrier family 26 member 10-like isoform X6 [Manis pentadactyla]
MSGLLGASTCPGPGEASDPTPPLCAKFREPLTEARFQQLFGDTELEPELFSGPAWRRHCRQWKWRARACWGPGAWRLLLARLPPLRWLPYYRWRAWLLGDAVAGVTVGIVHVPQGMAFALLTSVPPVFGLYTSFFPVLIYTLLGTGRHLSTGTFAVLSLMTGSAVERLVPEPLGGNLSGIQREQLDAQRVGAASALAFGSGALMLGMFVLQLGVLSTFLSEPVVKALTSGAALHVLVSQLPSLLGLPLPRQIGCFALFKTLAAVLTALPRSSPAELTISALSLALLVPIKELNVRFRDRLPTPIPGEIVLVLLASVLCFTSSLDTRYNVQIVGLLPGGHIGHNQPTGGCWWEHTAGRPLLLHSCFVCVAVAGALLPLSTQGEEQRGRGVGWLAGMATCQDIGVVSSPPLPQGCPGLHQHLQHAPDVLPDAGTSTTMAHQPCGLCCVDGHVGGGSDSECGPRPGCRCGLLHDDSGLPHPEVGAEMRGVGIREGREQSAWGDSPASPGWKSDPSFLPRVQCLALGLAEGTELYRPLRESHKLLQVPGLCILSYPTPLYFGTCGQFRRTLLQHLGLGEGGRETPKTDGPSDAVAEPVRVVVLDCSGVTFADAAGAREAVQLASRCRDAGIHLLLAQCNASVLGTLTQAGLLDGVTPEQLFVSVQDAAVHALERLVRDSSKGSGIQEVLG